MPSVTLCPSALAACGSNMHTIRPCRNACGLRLAAGRPAARRRAAALVVRAAGDEERSTVDWDNAWSKFTRQQSRQDGRAAPRTATRSWNDGPMADQIRKAESGLLNAWAGQHILPAALLLGVLVLILAAGPPPSDARCTLPWC